MPCSSRPSTREETTQRPSKSGRNSSSFWCSWRTVTRLMLETRGRSNEKEACSRQANRRKVRWDFSAESAAWWADHFGSLPLETRGTCHAPPEVSRESCAPGNNANDVNGYKAGLTEPLASASQIAAARFLETVSRLPGNLRWQRIQGSIRRTWRTSLSYGMGKISGDNLQTSGYCRKSKWRSFSAYTCGTAEVTTGE